jgi:hypothetical protein
MQLLFLERFGFIEVEQSEQVKQFIIVLALTVNSEHCKRLIDVDLPIS